MKFVKILFLVMTIFCSGQASLEEIFTNIYLNNLWGSKESVSGAGSTIVYTEVLRNFLPQLIKDLHIKTILDAPCGDFNWMRTVDFTSIDTYIGVDIVKDLINKNQQKYGSSKITFYYLDLTKDLLPKVDLIICRDLFQHLFFADIFEILKNFKKSSSKYLFVSTYATTKVNIDRDKIDHNYRRINLELPPFNFKPLLLVEEKRQGKHMGLFKIDDLLIKE